MFGLNPASADIRAARMAAGLTQTQAAKIIHCGLRTWQQWEAGDRQMHPAFWELFITKTSGLTPPIVGQQSPD